jgi:hypothetical protein
MESTVQGRVAEFRRPTQLEVVAGLLVVTTVVLHVIAMVPTYLNDPTSHQSILAQPDQAALYSILAAGWALVLVIGLTGPDRIPVSAGLAVGMAATEFGFRVSDLGQLFRYGYSEAGAGLWLMTAAWAVGAAAAVVLVIAARRHRHPSAAIDPADMQNEADNPVFGAGAAVPAVPSSSLAPASGPPADSFPSTWGSPTTSLPTAAGPPTTSLPVPSPTTSLEPIGGWPARPAPVPAGPPTISLAAVGAATEPAPITDANGDPAIGTRYSWTIVALLLGLVVAGAFLPAWDHYRAASSVTGERITFNLGNAFSGPWQVVLGNVLVAVSLVAVPLIGIRLRNRNVGAAVVVGALIVLTSQFVSAIVQVDQPVSPSLAGVTASQASRLGLTLSLRLTGWFVVDAIAAFALFAAVMVWATLRFAQENSAGTVPTAPVARSEAIPWVS